MAENEIGGDGTLDGLIRRAFTHLMADVRVAMPGKVVSFDKATRLGSIQPMLKRRYKGDTQATKLSVQQRVPVVEPRAGKAILSLPIAKGDPCLLVFADRAIDNWLGGAGVEPADPQDTRQHDLTDCFFIPGGWPELKSSNVPAPSGTAAELLVAPGTKIAIGNGQDELLKIASAAFGSLNDLATELKGVISEILLLSVNGNLGFPTIPGPLNQAQFIAIDLTIDTIKSSISSQITSLGKIKT